MVTPQWKLTVDSARCIGSGMCTGTAPEHFELIDGVSTPVDEQVGPDESIIDAAELCPVQAITVRDADHRLVAPEP